MSSPAPAPSGRSSQARDEARACPRCDTMRYPPRYCDEHRCSDSTWSGAPCGNSRTHFELGVCGTHARKRPEPETEAALRRAAARDDAYGSLVRRVTLIPPHLDAAQAFQAGLTINTDEFLAGILRGDGDKGAQLRSAGFTALADALGL